MLKLYTVNNEYLNFLYNVDKRVSLKTTRPYIGIVLKINDHVYFAPMSSKKSKNNQMTVLLNSSNAGTIKLNNMIPVEMSLLNLIDINNQDKNYMLLLQKEVIEINEKEKIVLNKARNLFNLVETKKNEKLLSFCRDFKVLEKVKDIYIKSMLHEFDPYKVFLIDQIKDDPTGLEEVINDLKEEGYSNEDINELLEFAQVDYEIKQIKEYIR